MSRLAMITLLISDHQCLKKVPPSCFDCVQYACKISLNGHVRMGFDYSKGVSRFFVRAERVQICSFLLGHDPPRTPQTFVRGTMSGFSTDVQTFFFFFFGFESTQLAEPDIRFTNSDNVVLHFFPIH